MSDTTDEKIKRPRGRPKGSTKQKLAERTTVYPFKSLDDILRLSETQLAVCFDELGAEPRPFKWSEDSDQSNVSHWHDFSMTMTDTARLASVPPMDELKASAKAIHLQCLRTQLLHEYLTHWIAELSDVQLIQEVERVTGEKLGESEKRYAKVANLRQTLEHGVWPLLLVASALYVWPINPLTGRSTKDEQEDGTRIPRSHD